PPRLNRWVMVAHLNRPAPCLAAIEIEKPAVSVRLFFRDMRLLKIKGVWLAIPILNNVTIAPKGDQRLRARPDTKTCHLGQIAAGRTAAHRHPLTIHPEEFRPLGDSPAIGILQILNDQR